MSIREKQSYLLTAFIMCESNSVSEWCDVLWCKINLQRPMLILQLVGLKYKFYISYLLVIFCCVTNHPQTSGLKQQYFTAFQISVASLVSAGSMWHWLELLICWPDVGVGVWSDLESQRRLHCHVRSLCFATQPHHRGILSFLTAWKFLGGGIS